METETCYMGSGLVCMADEGPDSRCFGQEVKSGSRSVNTGIDVVEQQALGGDLSDIDCETGAVKPYPNHSTVCSELLKLTEESHLQQVVEQPTREQR